MEAIFVQEPVVSTRRRTLSGGMLFFTCPQTCGIYTSTRLRTQLQNQFGIFSLIRQNNKGSSISYSRFICGFTSRSNSVEILSPSSTIPIRYMTCGVLHSLPAALSYDPIPVTPLQSHINSRKLELHSYETERDMGTSRRANAAELPICCPSGS